MGVKKFIKKSVAFVAAAAMALTMVVAPVGAGEAYAAEGTEDNLHLSKGIELQSDGNYKITLEAYSTGKDTTTTTEKAVPLDIVLVLDQSGSMKDDFTSSESYTKQSSKAYSYSNLNNNTYYYKDGDTYYEVKTDYEESGFLGLGKTYYMYYQKDGTTYYFYGDTITTEKKGVSRSYTTIWTGILYTRNATTRLAALKSAVTNFVNQVKQNSTLPGADHRISIVGFASDKSQGSYKNTEILTVQGNSPINYKKSTDNDNNFETALQNSLMDVKTQSSKIDQAINFLDASGDTYSEYGLDMAYRILQKHPVQDGENRKQIVVMFTDGYTAPSGTDDIDYSMSDRAIANAKLSKDLGATVYTIGIFDGANPSMDINNGYSHGGTSADQQLVAANRYMNLVSSNYPSATDMSTTGTANTEQGYYKAASNASDLEKVFTSIKQSETTSTTSVELTSNSVLRDVISDKFELPDGAEASAVSVYTADSKSVSSDGQNITWDTAVKDTSNKYKVSINGNTVDVTGFDYSQDYVTASHSGKKLIVEILVNGLQSGTNMDSNDTKQAKSGIYENSSATTAVKNFVSPKVTIPEYSYVLDYGKKVTIPNTDQSQNKAYSETTKINSTKAAPTTSPSIKKTYGTFALENKTLTYQPRRINWDGFDSIFSFGKKTGDEYEWSKTNVIPANSVYYEDDFGLTETKSEGEDESNIKIVYTGDWDTVPKNSRKDNSTQDSSNSQYGWDSSYVDDTQYSNGSAHMSSTVGATATFRFTGTGVEIYSRTDLTAGKVTATLRQIDKDGNKIAKTATIVDNKSSETYYQIPTLFFNDLDYGTYEVSIRVSAVIGETTDKDGNQSKRSNYYLDGIRVYNPLGKAPTDSTVKGAYEQAGEYNATYKKVRDILLDASNFTSDQIDENGNIKEGATFNNSGVVFIDEKEDGQEGSTSVVGTFKKYGPKDEVYLKKNQLIAFEINEGYTKLFVGAKTINGVETSMEVTDGNKAKKLISISSASDMYYEVDAKDSTKTPGRRLVIIKNTGDGLLSITKIRATGEGYKMDLGLTSNEVFTEANKFSSLPINKTNESGMPTENVNSDVKIDESDKSDKPNKTDNTNQNVKEFIKNLFGSINKWFSK